MLLSFHWSDQGTKKTMLHRLPRNDGPILTRERAAGL
jgi:hypothetical protein